LTYNIDTDELKTINVDKLFSVTLCQHFGDEKNPIVCVPMFTRRAFIILNEFIQKKLIRISADGTWGVLNIPYHLNQVLLHDLEENQ
jgi:hypothetical protein